jgi:hypothetical protein
MKKLRLFFLISGFIVIGQQLKAQKSECCHVSHRRKVQPPKFIDSNLFISDLKNKIDLKSIYKILRRYSISDAYLYNFVVTKEGKVIPERYLADTNIRLKKIHTFVKEVFNNYKWKPGYEKNRKVTSHLILCVFLYTDKRNTDVYIEKGNVKRKIFSVEIHYKDLR